MKVILYDAGNFSSGMKSLALSVACAIGFATPGICGDLGRADITSRNEASGVTSYSANCFGSFEIPKGPECLVEFVDNKMSVDSSSGISPNQVVSVSQNWHPNGYFVNVQYVASNGDSSLAQFSFLKKPVASQFLNTVVQFMSGGLITETETVEIEETTVEMEETTVEETYEVELVETCTGPTILCF